MKAPSVLKLFSAKKRHNIEKQVYVVSSNAPIPSNASTVKAETQISEGFYKPISEDNLKANNTSTQNSLANHNSIEAGEQIMVQDEKVVNDGADEQMLGVDDNEKLAARHDEIKFIKGDHQNGDAKIDIGTVNGKSFTGMSKEELMKYANDPFWVRLRWIFFVVFWLIWVGMLVLAIFIITGAPKCAAPQPLPWFKRGLLAKFGNIDAATKDDIQAVKKLQATGAIYELPAALTYNVKEPLIESKIKQAVGYYADSHTHVILDLTPNIISAESQLAKDALVDDVKRSALVWVDDKANGKEPNNWLKIGTNRTAWAKVDGAYVLSQFDDGTYDLRMNDTLVRQEFGDVLRHLLSLGVKGFRLKNTKFFLVSVDLADETPSRNPKDMSVGLDHYGFYNHVQTTFQSGLGDLLYYYRGIVKNASDDAVLTVAEDVMRPEAYQITGGADVLAIDLPMSGQFIKTVSSRIDKKLQNDLQALSESGRINWPQWNFGDVYIDTPVNPSAFVLFMSLLPGVPVVPTDSITYENVTAQTYKSVEQLRSSASYMHGEFHVYDAPALIAYARIKSGNPGYFVVFNPTAHAQAGNFTNLLALPDKMTVVHVSDNLANNNKTELKVRASVNVADIELEAYATAILTYVPVKIE